MRRLSLSLCLLTLPALAAAPPPVGPMQSGVFRGRPVTYELIGGRPVFEGDILLDHLRANAGDAPPGVHQLSVGLSYGQNLWPTVNGVATIPYIVSNASATLPTAISQFNSTFTGVIQFVAQTDQTDYVNFDFDSSNSSGTCESSVGRVGGEQVVTGAINCSLGTLLHEFGHVVGLFHEHSRSDRNSFITFNYANVIKGSIDNFTQLADTGQNLTLYDYASVMSYIPYAFSRNGGPVLDSIPPGMPLSNTVGYTAADIDGVKRLYGMAPTAVTITSNPPGLSVSIDGTAATTPVLHHWPLYSKHTLSVSASGQMLSGAAYTYGRWNDSTAATHTITVTPGVGTLTQPATSPAVTVYTANFVALSAYSATAAPTGAATIGTSPAPLGYPGLNGTYFVARQTVTLTPSPATGYQFLTWGGTDAPWSANPKVTQVPDLGAPLAVTAYETTQPITTITTSPPGLGFKVDGDYWYGPQNFASDFFSTWTPGSKHSLITWTPQQPYSVNTRFVYKSWSDGGAQNHEITVPTGASTLTGTFQAEYVPVAYQQPGCASAVSLSPVSKTGFYNAGASVKVTSAASSGWVFTGWLYDLSGLADPQSLVMSDEELAVANYNTSSQALKVYSLKPAYLVVGGSGTVQILGAGFNSTSIVFVNNVYRSTTYVNSGEIDVALTAADTASLGNFQIGVSDFPSGAPCSIFAAQAFEVRQ